MLKLLINKKINCKRIVINIKFEWNWLKCLKCDYQLITMIKYVEMVYSLNEIDLNI